MASKVVDYVEFPYPSNEQRGVGHTSNLADTLRILKEEIRFVRNIMTRSYRHKRSKQRLILYFFRVCQTSSDKVLFR